MNWRDKVKKARLPEDVVKLVLRGDLAVEHERLVDEIERARATKADSLAGKGTAALEKQLRAIEAEATDGVVEIRLRALPRAKRAGDTRPTWMELSEAHPPRVEDGMMNARDRLMGGQNADTFPEPFVRASIVAIDGDEGHVADDAWAELLGAITDRQFDELVTAAWDLNQGKVDVPFWSGGSKPTRTSAAG
jgi:hypothetical protein